MYQIAICYDDIKISSQLENWILEFDGNIDVDVFHSGDSLLFQMRQGVHYDLIFINLMGKEIDGIKIGLAIREFLRYDLVNIVYLSDRHNYTMELFKIRPFHFLLLPLSCSKVLEVVKESMNLSQKVSEFLEYSIGKTRNRVLLDNIVYLESNGRKITIHKNDGEIVEFYGKIDENYQRYRLKGFLSIHKSYLVNINFIQSYKYKEIILFNNTKLPISRSKRSEVRDILMSDK